jgi:hypothetical protein
VRGSSRNEPRHAIDFLKPVFHDVPGECDDASYPNFDDGYFVAEKSLPVARKSG